MRRSCNYRSNGDDPTNLVQALALLKGLDDLDANAFITQIVGDGYPLHSGTPNRLWFGDQPVLADSMIDR